jgi:hypothetical protein
MKDSGARIPDRSKARVRVRSSPRPRIASAASEQDRDDRDDDLVERLLEPTVYVDAAGEPLRDTTEEFIRGLASRPYPFRLFM